MNRYIQMLVLTAAPLLAHAEISAEAVLNKVYDSYDKKHDCWVVTDDGVRYCMKIDHSEKINTASGQRLYLLAAGNWVDDQGEATGGHANSGLIGAFVVEEQQGKAVIINSNAKIPMGSVGTPPLDWQFVRLGANDYWGWHNVTGWVGQGYAIAHYVVLAPYEKTIRDLAGFVASYDDTGACTEPEDEKNCEKTTISIESTLAIDSSQTKAKVFPLQITVTGKEKGKALETKTWSFPFDTKKWSYIEPNDWPLKDKKL